MAGAAPERGPVPRLVTQTLEMGQSFALSEIAFMHHPPLLAFYLTALAGCFMLAFDNRARRSIVPEMVPSDEVHNAVTLNSALMTSARIFGPALAGVLVVTLGYGWAFTIDGVSYLAVIASFWMMRTEDLEQPPRRLKAKHQVREAVRYVSRSVNLWIPLVMVTIVGTLTFSFSVVLPLFVERTLHGGDTAYTLLYSVLSIGSCAGALLAAHRHSIEIRHLVIASFGFGIVMLALAAMPNLGSAFPVALLLGVSSVAFMTSATAIVQVLADPAMRGRVLALQAMVLLGSTPIGGPVLGALCDAWGVRSGLVLGGLAALAAAVYGRVAGSRAAVRESISAGAVAVSELDAIQLEAV